MDEFSLTITLGNAAMHTTGDVSRALTAVSARLDAMHGYPGTDATDPENFPGEIAGIIVDDNGSTVGRWSFGPKSRAVEPPF